MNTSIKTFPLLSIFPTIVLIIWLLILGIGIYLVFLLIKALRIYIRKNS